MILCVTTRLVVDILIGRSRAGLIERILEIIGAKVEEDGEQTDSEC
jgi:hypothetical protein